MYFELAVEGIAAGDLGWILSKNPASSYSAQLRGGRSVEGQWKQHPTPHSAEEHEREAVCDATSASDLPPLLASPTGVTYSLKVRTDPVQFLHLLKKESVGSYVMSQLSCVSPFTLLGIKDCFRSVLQSKYPPQAAGANAKLKLRAIIGPWARVAVGRVRGVMRELGFDRVCPLADLPEVMARFTGPHQDSIGQRYRETPDCWLLKHSS
jgi:hypothetical protein